MKKAFGLAQIIIVIAVIAAIYFIFLRTPAGKTRNTFEEQTQVQTKKEIVNKKIKDIENTKAIKERIEQNLNRENY